MCQTKIAHILSPLYGHLVHNMRAVDLKKHPENQIPNCCESIAVILHIINLCLFSTSSCYKTQTQIHML